ncbi:serine/threonine-protein kinase [Synechocystis sp. LKSZ1]|uniref:serine/threonine-protein kinase n=1 Tax=Synechocystis sp. LKSZ1 TaxID=3144951 RepID=UPI00336BC2BE
MSYCVNPSCPHPKNPNDIQVCQACGGKLRLNGRYQVLGLLGKGGFGATFAAADVGLPGTPICVVKQLRPATDDPNIFRMAKELFEREAQTLGKVGDHPQVPRLLDYFEEDQQFYLVQEYVKGHNLHQEVKKNGPFTEGSVKQFLSELMPVLSYIHSQKVIHRDIKPANLIRRQTDQKLVLIDFGAVKNEVNTILAANTSAQTALTAFAVGTAGFAPPEQMAMRPVYASDIYAVGVTCIYLLTGRTPKDIECNHQTGEMDWERYVTVGESFAKVLKNMLELSVRHRYKTAQQVLDALNIPAYDDGMMQGMITTGFFNPSKTTQDRDETDRAAADPSTAMNTSFRPPGSALSGMSTGIKTRTRTGGHPSPPTQFNLPPRTPERPMAPRAGGLNVGENVNVSIKPNAPKGHSSKRDRRGQDPTAKKEPVTWNSKGVLGAYEKGQRDFSDQDLRGISLPRAFLPGLNCYGSDLTGANLSNANLTNTNFGKAVLQNANFRDADLSEAYFGYANLEGADLRGTQLTGANFKYANVQGANLCGVDLSGVQITMEQVALTKTNWRTIMPNGKRGLW